MGNFRIWLEQNELPAILVLSAHNYDGSAHEAGGDYDPAKDGDYVKHLGMPIGKIKKKYSHNRTEYDSEEWNWEDGEELPGIEGIHWGWDMHITPEMDGLLMGNNAMWIENVAADYYHSTENDAHVYVEVQPELLPKVGDANKIPSLEDEAGHMYREKAHYFKWEGLAKIVPKISKKQGISPPSNMPHLPAVKPRLSADPRLSVKKRPGESREDWLMRSVGIEYGSLKPKIGQSGYDPSDKYWQR